VTRLCDGTEAGPGPPIPLVSVPVAPPNAKIWPGASRYRGYPADWIAVGWSGVPRSKGYVARCFLRQQNGPPMLLDEKTIGTTCTCTFEGIPPRQDAAVVVIPFNEGGVGLSSDPISLKANP